ncbi:MAG: hypothetical protein JWN70_2755 [Planctomycetaceae bacterium]|nr:hypothetical protein [Planctomycetaceae bacterium]
MRFKRRHLPAVLSIEHLEVRNLLSAVTVSLQAVIVSETEGNDTLDRANDLGTLVETQVNGTLDASGNDVDWFEFQLAAPSTVTLNTTAGTLGLYNNAHDDFNDLRDLIGHRLLAQDGTADTAGGQLTRDLAAGTYYVAVSGAGNRYFNPFIADSGLPGAPGSYQLTLESNPLDLSNSDDPQSLAVDASSLIIRVDLSSALDFTPTITLAAAGGADVPLLWTNQNPNIAELQIATTTPLVAGDYTAVITDADGHVRLTVAVHLPDSVAGGLVDQGNDTPATSIDLGAIEQQGLVQVAGAIGDDAYYDFSSIDPSFNPGNDVDLYHFTITATSPVGLQAEVFAGRISSPLDAGLSLYRLDPVSGHLQFIAGNNQSYNPTASTNHLSSLFYDPAVMAGVTAGDYYIAVSHGANTPSPVEMQLVGEGSGIFDPEVSHSGSVGESVGPYVLNLKVVPLPDPPVVTSVSIEDQSILPSAPTAISVGFSEYMNLTGLAFAAFQQTSQSTIAGVYIVDAQGHKTFPRLTDFDTNTMTAQFLMLDRLASGSYELHLSGSQGLTNIAGGALVGNTAGGDYVTSFTVAPSNVGTDGNPLVWTHPTTSDSDSGPQSLGILFPHELQAGVQIVRAAGSASGRDRNQSDDYQFEILQQQDYFIYLSGRSLPNGVTLTLFDHSGVQVPVLGFHDGHSLSVTLQPGSYVLHVGDWSTNQAHSLRYQIDLYLTGSSDDSPPLFSGPGPAVGIRLVTNLDQGTGGATGGGISFPGAGGSSGSGSSGSGSIGGGSIGGTGGSSGLTSSGPANVERDGLPRISLPQGIGNLAIGIPSLKFNAADRAGLIQTAGRSLRQTSGLNIGPTFGGLNRLADGPVGAVGAANDELSLTMSAMQKLNTLIGARLSSKSSLARDIQSDDPLNRPTDNDRHSDPGSDQLSADNRNADDNLTTIETDSAESQTRATPEDDLSQSVTAVLQQLQRQVTRQDQLHILTDSAFIPLESEQSPDNVPTPVYAAGLGAFLLQAVSHRMQQLASPGSPSNVNKNKARFRSQRLIT